MSRNQAIRLKRTAEIDKNKTVIFMMCKEYMYILKVYLLLV